MELTSIYWPDMAEPPASLVTGQRFCIKDITLYCQGYYRNVIEDTHDAEGVRLHRVRIRANAFWCLGEPGKENRGRKAVDTRDKIGDAILLHSRNFEITNCDILASRRAVILHNAEDGIISGNTIRHGHNGLGAEGVDRIIIENNVFAGGDMAASGNFISSYWRTFSRNIYYACNRFEHAYGYDREFMTLDGSGGTYGGRIERCEGTAVILATDPVERTYSTRGEPHTPQKDSWIGAGMFLLDGTGAGQYRIVTGHEGRRWEIDRPWDIAPDATSFVSIVPFRGRVLFIGNALADGGSVQAFGTSIECIFAENRGARMSGFTPVWGYNGHDWGNQPSWYCQFFDNEIIEGNGWGHESAAVRTLTSWEEDRSYAGPLSRGVTMRRNLLRNNTGIEIQGVTHDVIVEKCVVSKTEKGIVVAPEPEHVLLRKNTFSEVQEPVSGKGAAKSSIQN
jgi:hypothetical protein